MRSRRFAFRGAGGEPPRRRWRLRGLTCPSDPAGVFAPSAPINWFSLGSSFSSAKKLGCHCFVNCLIVVCFGLSLILMHVINYNQLTMEFCLSSLSMSHIIYRHKRWETIPLCQLTMLLFPVHHPGEPEWKI